MYIENFSFIDLSWPQYWPEPKNETNDSEPFFDGLSNTARVFPLSRPGADLEGGLNWAPHQGEGGSEAHRGGG